MVDGSRRDLIDALAEEILHNYAHGRVIVAIDGEDTAAADAFGADLVELLKKRGHSAFAARMNDFVSPRDRREAWGPDSAEVRYRNTYDYSVLRRVLIDPFRMGGSTGFVAAAYDRAREQQIQAKWLTAPEDAILVLSGEFLQRPELRGLWNFTAWLEAAAPKNGAAKDGAKDGAEIAVDPLTIAARKLYAKDVKARETASAIVDNTDPERPLRIFADSC
jgi:uridine kinase